MGNLNGKVKSVQLHNETVSVDALKPSPIEQHTMYMGLNKNYAEDGPAATWTFASNPTEFVHVSSGRYTGNSRDVQWASTNEEGIWVAPTSSNNSVISMRDTGTGEDLYNVKVNGGFPSSFEDGDLNKFQMLDSDTILVQSFRYTNAFLKTQAFALEDMKHVDTDVMWIVGSDNGTMDIVDFDGTVYTPRTEAYNRRWGGAAAPWAGQHNLEYFGENEYMMFDNAFEVTGSEDWNTDGAGFIGDSRMLVVKVDETANTATLDWEYKMGYNTSIYGDADRLPTGNILGCGWPSKGRIKEKTFDAEIVEVTRETNEVAWRAEIWGNGRRKVETYSPYGWIMYSVERIYTSPIISGGASCTSGTSSSTNTVSMVVYNNFKLSSTYAGYYSIIETSSGEEITSGSFDFTAHWRETVLDIEIGANDCVQGCEVAITNKVMDNTTTTFSC